MSLVSQSIVLKTVVTCSTISCQSRFLTKNFPVPQNVQPTGHPDCTEQQITVLFAYSS